MSPSSEVEAVVGGQEITDDMPIGVARLLLQHLLKQGVDCPLCEQRAKMYKISMSPAMMIGLVCFYKEHGTEWGDNQKVRQLRGATDNKKESKLRFWNLFERKPGTKSGAAIWRVTTLGEAFIRGEVKVPKYAFTYNDELYGHDGDDIGIEDVIGRETLLNVLA